MKMKERMKRFWTLNRHHAEGFTLIELIVVIAVIAILAGVAVPAYGAYVNKANKAKDIALVGDVQYALALGIYSGFMDDEPTGTLVLSMDNTVQGVTPGVALALEATFGANYENGLKLAYNEWKGAEVTTPGETLEPTEASKSSYLNGQRNDRLLSDVEILTKMSVNLADAILGDMAAFLPDELTMSDLYTVDGVCLIDTVAEKYGITKPADMSWEEWSIGEDVVGQPNGPIYGNLLVLAAAEESAAVNSGEAEGVSASFYLISQFSLYYAYAAYSAQNGDSTFSDALDAHMAHLDGTYMEGLDPVTSAVAGKDWYDSLTAAAGEGFLAYCETMNEDDGMGQASIDGRTFLSILEEVASPNDAQLEQIKGDLGNPNLFTNGVVTDMFNDYVDRAFGRQNPDGTVPAEDGTIVIQYTYSDGELVIINSMGNQ